MVVVPPMVSVPLSDTAFPELLKVAVPLIVDAANSISAFSVTATFSPVSEREPKVEDASSKVMFCPLALMVVTPPTIKVPASVTSPLEVMDRLPVTELEPNCVASASVIATSAPVKVSEPKVDAVSSKVML